jgi:glutamate--cysteine ligase
MMFRTATVQANLDFVSEADMVTKLRVGLALQPIVTALFANSPFIDGEPTGLLSQRSQIWRDTDAARTGMLPFAFEAGMGFERYVDYALDVPLYFVKRGDVYHDVSGASFRDLLDGRLAALPGERATLSDWTNHLGAIFPEVRLKRYLEMRGADAGPRSHITALPALFVGLFYDQAALDGAAALVEGWTQEQREALRVDAPRLGLKARLGKREARDIALDMLALSRAGLARRAARDAQGRDETIYLAPLEAIAETGRTLAEQRLEDYHGRWRGSVDPAFEDCVL